MNNKKLAARLRNVYLAQYDGVRNKEDVKTIEAAARIIEGIGDAPKGKDKPFNLINPCEVLKKNLEANKRALKIYQDACRIYLHSATQEFTPKFLKHAKKVEETAKHVSFQLKNFEEAWGEYVRIRTRIEEEERTLALLEEAKNNKPVVKEGEMKK